MDMSFQRPVIEKIAKPAFVAVLVLAIVLVLRGLFVLISDFINMAAFSGSASYALLGLSSFLYYCGAGFLVLVLGRLIIEHILHSHRARVAASAQSGG